MLDLVDENGAAALEAPSLGLGEYVARAGRAIRQTLPPKAWVEAVILEAKVGRAGLNIELVEAVADTRRDAYLRCFLADRTKARIEDEIGASLDAKTLKGRHARLLLKPGFHPRYHFQGDVLDLDPAMIESLVAQRVEEIRRKLRLEGLFHAQSRLPDPRDVFSVAVLHPERSAGWADVEAELERLQACGILALTSIATPFEGNGAAAGIADAIRTIGEAGEGVPDLILIVRGGGAAAGLAGLADLALAKAICLCPIPIVTGLGHASDRTLLDEIAWCAADTPSKALGVVKAILRRHCEDATADRQAIVADLDRRLVQIHAPLLKASSSALAERVDRIFGREFSRVRELAHEIECHVIRFRGEMAAVQSDLDRMASSVLSLAPRIPREAAVHVAALHRSVVCGSKSRLPSTEILGLALDRQEDAAARFLARRRDELSVVLASLEASVRRRWGDEVARLMQAKVAVEALEATTTLRRGFVLPLDAKHRIIRSAKAARAAAHIELLFADGSVACRPSKLS